MKTFLTIVGFVGALALVGRADMEAEMAEAAYYCEMVELWENSGDGYVGIPPYRDDVEC